MTLRKGSNSSTFVNLRDRARSAALVHVVAQGGVVPANGDYTANCARRLPRHLVGSIAFTMLYWSKVRCPVVSLMSHKSFPSGLISPLRNLA